MVPTTSNGTDSSPFLPKPKQKSIFPPDIISGNSFYEINPMPISMALLFFPFSFFFSVSSESIYPTKLLRITPFSALLPIYTFAAAITCAPQPPQLPLAAWIDTVRTPAARHPNKRVSIFQSAWRHRFHHQLKQRLLRTTRGIQAKRLIPIFTFCLLSTFPRPFLPKLPSSFVKPLLNSS